MKRTTVKQSGMKREDLARALAERSRMTQGQAQDELDRMVHEIVKSLRRGRPAEMPGIGKMTVKTPCEIVRITEKARGAHRAGPGGNSRP